MTCRSRCPDTGTLVCLDLHSISWVMLQFSTVVIPLTGVHCELNFLALTKIQTAHGELAFAGKKIKRGLKVDLYCYIILLICMARVG